MREWTAVSLIVLLVVAAIVGLRFVGRRRRHDQRDAEKSINMFKKRRP